MYDGKAGIEVFVRPYDSDTAYREYKAPRSPPLCASDEKERYIEAVNNERFEVFVKLDESFDFKTYNQARVYIAMDGCIFCASVLSKPKRNKESTVVLRDCFSRQNGEYQGVGFCFRETKACTYCRSTFATCRIC